MRLSQLHHGSLVVKDLERAAAFYRDVLGLQEIEIPATFDPAGIRARWFQIGVQHIHLLEDFKSDPRGPWHVALQVDDARAAREQLRARGVDIEETIPIPGADRFFVSDPDGNRLEIIEWKQDYPVNPVGNPDRPR